MIKDVILPRLRAVLSINPHRFQLTWDYPPACTWWVVTCRQIIAASADLRVTKMPLFADIEGSDATLELKSTDRQLNI